MHHWPTALKQCLEKNVVPRERSHSVCHAGGLQTQLSGRAGGKSFTTEAGGRQELEDPPQPDDVGLFLHTSGTTSRPKGVPLTHANLAASLDNIVATYELTPPDRSLLVMPLFHVHGLMAGACKSLALHFRTQFAFLQVCSPHAICRQARKAFTKPSLPARLFLIKYSCSFVSPWHMVG